MIFVVEQDLRAHDGVRFAWRPELFRGKWCDGRMWRLSWGLWSISYYPSAGLRDFHDHIASGRTEWRK